MLAMMKVKVGVRHGFLNGGNLHKIGANESCESKTNRKYMAPTFLEPNLCYYLHSLVDGELISVGVKTDTAVVYVKSLRKETEVFLHQSSIRFPCHFSLGFPAGLVMRL
jgi:hypothetical protein